MSSKNGSMNPEERFNYIEGVLAEIVAIQRETNCTMRRHAKVLKAHAQTVVKRHGRRLESDERMNRIERHLEVLKKRRGRSSSELTNRGGRLTRCEPASRMPGARAAAKVTKGPGPARGR